MPPRPRPGPSRQIVSRRANRARSAWASAASSRRSEAGSSGGSGASAAIGRVPAVGQRVQQQVPGFRQVVEEHQVPQRGRGNGRVRQQVLERVHHVQQRRLRVPAPHDGEARARQLEQLGPGAGEQRGQRGLRQALMMRPGERGRQAVDAEQQGLARHPGGERSRRPGRPTAPGQAGPACARSSGAGLGVGMRRSSKAGSRQPARPAGPVAAARSMHWRRRAPAGERGSPTAAPPPASRPRGGPGSARCRGRAPTRGPPPSPPGAARCGLARAR